MQPSRSNSMYFVSLSPLFGTFICDCMRHIWPLLSSISLRVCNRTFDILNGLRLSKRQYLWNEMEIHNKLHILPGVRVSFGDEAKPQQLFMPIWLRIICITRRIQVCKTFQESVRVCVCVLCGSQTKAWFSLWQHITDDRKAFTHLLFDLVSVLQRFLLSRFALKHLGHQSYFQKQPLQTILPKNPYEKQFMRSCTYSRGRQNRKIKLIADVLKAKQ